MWSSVLSAVLFGVYFYNRDYRSYYHALWHIFVLMGSLTHYLAVLFYAVPHHT